MKGTIYDALKNVQCVYRKKDAITAKDRRLQGLELMKNRNQKKALMILCQSILRAPPKGIK